LYADEFIRSRNFFIVNLFLHTGLRISELVSLDIKDMEKTKKTDYLTVIGKGNKERIIPINVEELSKELGDDDNLIKVYLKVSEFLCSSTNLDKTTPAFSFSISTATSSLEMVFSRQGLVA